MRSNKGWLTLLGFLLAGTGFLALILSLVGLNLAFLTWIDLPGPLFGLIARIAIILVGMILIYLSQTNFAGDIENEQSNASNL
jgi:membrane-bound ClpP family serine protease